MLIIDRFSNGSCANLSFCVPPPRENKIKAQRSEFDFERRSKGADEDRPQEGLKRADFATTMWPHGQVVKTAASHAVNVGSNPAGVTKLLDKRRKMDYNT